MNYEPNNNLKITNYLYVIWDMQVRLVIHSFIAFTPA